METYLIRWNLTKIFMSISIIQKEGISQVRIRVFIILPTCHSLPYMYTIQLRPARLKSTRVTTFYQPDNPNSKTP